MNYQRAMNYMFGRLYQGWTFDFSCRFLNNRRVKEEYFFVQRRIREAIEKKQDKYLDFLLQVEERILEKV